MIGHRAILAGILATFVATGTASAQGWAVDGFYLKGFGGASFVDDETVRLSGSDAVRGFTPRLDYDTGYVLGLGLGATITPNVALEIEYAHRSADYQVRGVVPDGSPVRGSGDTSVNAVMANGFYVLDPVDPAGVLQPYVGLGLGGASIDVDGDDTGTQFAWQIMGGARYAVNPNLGLFGELRYFDVDAARFSSRNGIRASAGFDAVDLIFGASYRF
jgi:opacity protein-like surface antigen